MKLTTVSGVEYSLGRLDAMKQFHVVRRVVPIMVETGVSIADLSKIGSSLDDESTMLRVMGVAMKAVSKMTDEDVEYVINACLAVVSRRTGDVMAPVMSGAHRMFADMDMAILIQLTVEVLKENLAGFFTTASGASTTPQGS